MNKQNSIINLNPTNVWKIFKDICDIPHASGNEKKIINFIKLFGERNNLPTTVDKYGNILIKKPPSNDMVNKKTVVLQSHVDMVPQKNSDKSHNFDTDPIKPVIDGEWVRADGTSLGADNGIGVAIALAILENNKIKNPPIEALFTTSEEIGLIGALNLDKNLLSGEILINLDTEDINQLFIGCAGGINTEISLKFDKQLLNKTIINKNNYTALQINIMGLKGGHSGADINSGRANSIKLITRILFEINKNIYFYLLNIDGGTNLSNAIPREASATIIIENSNLTKAEKIINKIKNVFNLEYGLIEKDLSILTNISNSIPDEVMTYNFQTKLIKCLYSCYDGVIKMSKSIDGLVETSTNLASIKTNFSLNSIEIVTSQRSSINESISHSSNIISNIFELIGADIITKEEYPGWNPNINSEILKKMKNIYREEFNKDPEILSIHAGLECGVLKKKFPKLDAISVGPTIIDPHSPDEKVNIKSVEDFWNYLIKVLELI